MVRRLILVSPLDRLKIRLLIEVLISVRLPSVRISKGCLLLLCFESVVVELLNSFINHLSLAAQLLTDVAILSLNS